MSLGGGDEQTLREVVEALAPLERRAGGSGELGAADWLAARLGQSGCDVAVEAEEFLDGYARVFSRLSAASALAGLTALAVPRARRLAGLAAGAATLAMADDISNGPRLFRRATGPAKTTWNVVATSGDRSAPRTLVVLAHHDAAPTGRIFDDRPQAWVGERFPGLLERIDTSLPMWWLLLGTSALVALGAAGGRRELVAAGAAGSAVGIAAFEDIARSPVVPGGSSVNKPT